VRAQPDPVEGFFDELSRRGHDSLLDRLDSTGRFEVRVGEHTDCWLVTVHRGHVTVSRGGGDADWVLRADRETLKEIIQGDTAVLATYLGGELEIVLQDPSLRLGLIVRLFAGPPSADKRLMRDERSVGRAPR
jgi:hypothetical protein